MLSILVVVLFLILANLLVEVVILLLVVSPLYLFNIIHVESCREQLYCTYSFYFVYSRFCHKLEDRDLFITFGYESFIWWDLSWQVIQLCNMFVLTSCFVIIEVQFSIIWWCSFFLFFSSLDIFLSRDTSWDWSHIYFYLMLA